MTQILNIIEGDIKSYSRKGDHIHLHQVLTNEGVMHLCNKLAFLTLSQTASFRLFQTKTGCR